VNYVRDEWHYFPRLGELCLLGIRGYACNPRSGHRVGGGSVDTVTFTLCENTPPFRELRHFRPVAYSEPAMSERPDESAALVKRRCRWCGRLFKQVRGEARRRGCPECEPPLIPRSETVRPSAKPREP